MSATWTLLHMGDDETIRSLGIVRNKMYGLDNGKAYEQFTFPGRIGKKMQSEYELRVKIYIRLLESRCRTEFCLKKVSEDRDQYIHGWEEHYINTEGSEHTLKVMKSYAYDEYGSIDRYYTTFELDGRELGKIFLCKC